MSKFDFEKRIIEYHYFHFFDANVLYEQIYNVLQNNQIHSSDAGVLCSKVEVLRDIDFLIRTKKKELTTTTFETKEEFEKIKDSGVDEETLKNKLEDLRKIKKNHFWMKTGTVKLSTVHSFKGWEIDTLFLFIETEEEESKKFTNAELIYTGLTRARRNLIVFNLGNNKYDDFFKKEIEKKYEYK